MITVVCWHCPHSRPMRSRVYVTVGCPSISSINSNSSVRRVCCWAPCGQETSIDICGRRRRVPTIDLQHVRAQQKMRVASCENRWTRRLNTHLFELNMLPLRLLFVINFYFVLARVRSCVYRLFFCQRMTSLIYAKLSAVTYFNLTTFMWQ